MKQEIPVLADRAILLRVSTARNLDSKYVVDVIITLKKRWKDNSGKSMAIYDVDLD